MPCTLAGGRHQRLKGQIARSSGQVDHGVRLVGEAGEALKRISDQIKAANEIVAKIAHSASAQDTTLRSISSSMNPTRCRNPAERRDGGGNDRFGRAAGERSDELLNLIRSFRVGGGNDHAVQAHRAA
ncbi:hypothetical protein J2W42_001269 [Rhizobium tibeticum]|nr:hypothetical protein [Rhizobium tibeticum]